MPVVTARRYVEGCPSPHAIDLAAETREPPPPGAFDWVGMAEPEADEMERIRALFGLHPLAVEDALKPTQLPKVEAYARHLFIIARTAAMEEGENIGYGQVAIFLGKDFVVTVRFGTARHFRDLRERLECDPERLAEGADYVAHAVLDHVVDGFSPIPEKLEEAVQRMEERAIDVFPEQSTIRRIFRLRRQLRRFDRLVGPMAEVCERLAMTDMPFIDAGARVWFRDVLDHVRRALTRTAGLKETLASIVETASLLEAHRQGEMTRSLAAWAAILAVPTAIAGIYGMNFEYMPELHSKLGYPLTLAAIITICGGLYWRFRRIGWL
jgi:magnesium transporter